MRNKGISLITLVITIVVIIILTGAIVLSLSNNNPIAKASEAVAASNLSTVRDQFSIAYATELAAQLGNTSQLTAENIVAKMGGASAIPTGIQVTTAGILYTGSDPVMRIEAAKQKVQVIPTGFSLSSVASEQSVETGLVIKDNVNGNEFVWVPVKDGVGTNGAYTVGDNTTVQYKKWCTTLLSYASTTDDTLPTGITNESAQITKYGGFYIARYEAGKETTTLVSKKNAVIWNNINYADSKVKAEAMYSNAVIKSGLVTGTQWDTAMKWIQNSGTSVTDSSTWGNHLDSTVTGHGSLQVSGYSEIWKTKNIYDLAGNVWEWTSESNGANRIDRGGSNYSNGAYDSVSARGDISSPTLTNQYISFRPVLYMF